MQTHIKNLCLIWISFAVFLLPGCQSTRSALPNNGPTMAEIYQEAMAESEGSSITAIRGHIQPVVAYNGKEELAGYTRTAQNEVNQLFPELPNPQITVFIFPHLAEEGVPVPGYTTAFSLYGNEYYALPGEVRR